MTMMMMMIVVLVLLIILQVVNSINIINSISKCIDTSYNVIDTARFLDVDMTVSNDRQFANDTHTVVFVIKQNIKALHNKLMEVSNPKSLSYGKYLNRDEISLLGSYPDYSRIVKDILKDIPNIVVKDTIIDNDYITVSAPIYILEDIFNSKYHLFTYKDGRIALRMKQYSLPLCLSQYISDVFYTIDYPFTKRNRKTYPNKSNHRIQQQHQLQQQQDICAESGEGIAKVIEGGALLCNNDIVIGSPQYITSIYDIQNNTGSSLASQCVYESECWFSDSDLSDFETLFDLPKVTVITKCDAKGCPIFERQCGEANLGNAIILLIILILILIILDVQYLSGVSLNTPMYAWVIVIIIITIIMI